MSIVLTCRSAGVSEVSELAGAESRVLVAVGGAVGVRAARVRVARVHALLLRVAAAGKRDDRKCLLIICLIY